jgi:hypothetical protein
VLFVGLLLGPLSVQANPISMEVARGRQVPSSRHVQLTYAVDGSTPTTPISATKDGASLSLSWALTSASFTANTGSGLVSLSATQACDCDVAVGTRTYVVKVNSAMGGTPQDLTIKVDVVQNLAATADAGVPAGDVMPWSIPEPGQIQGLDCMAACSGATNKDAGSGSPEKEVDDEGCAMGGRPASLSLLMLALGLGLLLRRR